MLITESFVDVPVPSSPGNTLRLHLFLPALIQSHPKATFPGIAVFTEIYQVTGPVERFCRQIAANGYVVACPETYHDFEAPGTVIPYDVEDTDRGNRYKIEKTLESYDVDATLTLDFLSSHSNVRGRKLGATGMCLGGHLAFRCAFDPRVSASVCFFATDIHSSSLAKGKNDDSLLRCGDIRGECVMIWGKHDPHIPTHGRQLIYQTLVSRNLPAQHAFIRDELSKGRYDPPLARIGFDVMMETFHRRLYVDLGEEGPSNGDKQGVGELVC
ncbi:dienelactone hydrolase [Chytridium lagenaria]|nr:dienelactone hydrolase [Chytridium lagenaria]